MKKKMNLLLPFLLIAALLTVSCKKNVVDDNGQEPEKGSYTIIFYGSGGGDLDEFLDDNLSQVESLGYVENVNFTALVKFSSSVQSEEGLEGTLLLTMESEGRLSSSQYGDVDFQLNNPQNLADFITDAQTRLPAEKYILVLWNHGTAFNIMDQPVQSSYTSKAILYDDNLDNTGMSIFEIEEALRLADAGIDLVYWDACLMNMIEHNYQIRNYTDYILGSAHSADGSGGNYASLISLLSENDDIESAITNYVNDISSYWSSVETYDLALTQTSSLEQVASAVVDCRKALCDYRDGLEADSDEMLEYLYYNGDPSEDAAEYFNTTEDYYSEFPPVSYTEGGVLYYFEPEMTYSVDLCQSFSALGAALECEALTTAASILQSVVDDMIIAQSSKGLDLGMSSVSLGLLWQPVECYNYYFTSDFLSETYRYFGGDVEVKTMAELYTMTAFNQATGWSDFLIGNEMIAVGYNEDHSALEKLTPGEDAGDDYWDDGSWDDGSWDEEDAEYEEYEYDEDYVFDEDAEYDEEDYEGYDEDEEYEEGEDYEEGEEEDYEEED
ncbi:MAG: clostripain-related cysteine peptidase [Rikenellaceae bacterium]